MNLETEYLGLKLKSPLVPSASPLSENLDNIKMMEDAGAAAIVLYSLFEEQLSTERLALNHHLDEFTDSFSEASSFFPEPKKLYTGAEEYLKHIQACKKSVNIPIIASLNGTHIGTWIDYAKQIQEAGADALELNIYRIPTDIRMTAVDIEKEYIQIVQEVKNTISIPLSVKLSPYFTNLANIAHQIDQIGINGLILFNRFYQPDIDLENLEVKHHIILSTPQALRLPMRWIAILYGKIGADLASSSGIHKAVDVIKTIMAGAKVTMLCSALLRYGIERIRTIEEGMIEWMKENEYESLQQMLGSMSHQHTDDPSAFERVQYMKALKGYTKNPSL